MKKTFSSSKQNTPPCNACYRPCSEKEDYYCQACVKSGAYKWHRDMLTRWQTELAAKEEAS
jgi:hypothetical protein